MKKRLFAALLVSICMVFMVTGCSSKSKKDKDEEETEEATTEEAVTEIAITTDEPVAEVPVEPETEPYDFSVEEEVEEEVVEEETPEVEVDEFGVATIDEKKMYATEAVRIRREPNTDSEVAGKLASGEEVTVNGQSDEWHRIKKGDETLYVKSEYLTDTKPETKTEDTATADTNTETKKTDEQKAQEAALKAAQDATAAATQAASQAAQTANTEEAEKAAQAAAAAAAQTAQAAAGAYDVNGLKVNAKEYQDLLNTWRWATANGTDEEALEIVKHHPAGDLEAVLKSHGLR